MPWVEDCDNHELVIIGSERYRGIDRREFLVEIYMCQRCGAGETVYYPVEETQRPKASDGTLYPLVQSMAKHGKTTKVARLRYKWRRLKYKLHRK